MNNTEVYGIGCFSCIGICPDRWISCFFFFWWSNLVGGFKHLLSSIIYGMSSFPLTNSYFSEGWLNHQAVMGLNNQLEWFLWAEEWDIPSDHQPWLHDFPSYKRPPFVNKQFAIASMAIESLLIYPATKWWCNPSFFVGLPEGTSIYKGFPSEKNNLRWSSRSPSELGRCRPAKLRGGL